MLPVASYDADEREMTPISGFILGLSALLMVESLAAQTTYPEKPIRLIVGLPAGGQPDTVARLFGQKFTEAWGKPVLIDNVTGAAGAIAADRVAKALLGEDEIYTDPERQLADCLERLAGRSRDERLRALTREIREAENRGDAATLQALLAEKQRLTSARKTPDPTVTS